MDVLFSGKCNKFLDSVLSGPYVSIVRSVLLRTLPAPLFLAIYTLMVDMFNSMLKEHSSEKKRISVYLNDMDHSF